MKSDLELEFLSQVRLAGLPEPEREYQAIAATRRLMLICPVCKKEYSAHLSEIKRGQYKVCSNVCKSKYFCGKNNHGWKEKITKVCLFCGKKYFAYPHEKDSSKYCSKDCFLSGHKKQRIKKFCELCGKLIEEKGRKKFCSQKCADEGNFINRHLLNKCSVCGKEHYSFKYDFKNGTGRYCSIDCFMKVRTPMTIKQSYSMANGGKREDLNNQYFRSSWEANYARYLNWLVERGEIAEWKFEPDTFEFTEIKRGNRFYTPDFKITNKDGSIEYHEVKGYMSEDSRIKLKRMAKYFSEIKLILIDKESYKVLSRQLRNIIPNWEWNEKHSY